jgi:molybdopterin-guanine dinucleotide biosynthesis protein A
MKKILSGGRPMTLVVLAGGQSRRMGRDKALLPVGPSTAAGAPGFARGSTSAVLARGYKPRASGEPKARPWTLIEATIRPLAESFDEILIGVSPGQRIPPSPGRIVEDEIAGQGPLRGILTGLRAARNETCFVLACDMPGLRAGVVRKIARASKDVDLAIAVTDSSLKEPLLGVYKKTVIPAIESLLGGGKRSVLDLFDHVRTREVLLVPGDIPPNINTPEEYEAMIERAAISQMAFKLEKKR